ncbi:hypothetical protein ApDm4_0574 [Acetobacter pomorum]|nr:hypothetical protein ApDm4_0574 [Acetobacter pomorum]
MYSTTQRKKGGRHVLPPPLQSNHPVFGRAPVTEMCAFTQ